MKTKMTALECLKNIEETGSIETNIEYLKKEEMGSYFVAEVTKEVSFLGFKAEFKYVIVGIVYNRYQRKGILQGGSVVCINKDIKQCDYHLIDSIPSTGVHRNIYSEEILKDIEEVFEINKFDYMDFDCDDIYYELTSYKYNVEDVFN